MELANNIGLEIADVYPGAPDVIFGLVGHRRRISYQDLNDMIQSSVTGDEVETFLDLIVWYGIVGPVDKSGKAHFIYDHTYEMRLLKAVHSPISPSVQRLYEVNPAFWPALEIDDM